MHYIRRLLLIKYDRIYKEIKPMSTKNNISYHNLKRLEKIASMLKEMRFAEGRCQDELMDYGISRRQVQRGEYGNNLTLIGLFNLIDAYGYRLDEFFEGME